MYRILQYWSIYLLRFIPIFFVVSVGIAMYFFAGGNIHDPEQAGYVFTHNFLSDLGRFQSFTGEPNFLSMFLFNQAMFLFVFIGIGFLFIPSLFSDDKLTYYIAWIGSSFFFLGTIFFASVGLTPYDLFFDPHVFFAINAFRLLIPGIICYLIVLIRSKTHKLYTAAISLLLLMTISYVIYQLTYNDPRESYEAMVQQASIQKIIALVNVLAMFAFSFAFSDKLSKQTK